MTTLSPTWQAAAVAKFREIQTESAAQLGKNHSLNDRISRLVRNRSNEIGFREYYLRSGAATDVGLKKIDEKIETIGRMLKETDLLKSGFNNDLERLRSDGFKALVAVGCIDEDFESEQL